MVSEVNANCNVVILYHAFYRVEVEDEVDAKHHDARIPHVMFSSESALLKIWFLSLLRFLPTESITYIFTYCPP